MTFLERETMDMLPSSFELQSTEAFYSVDKISMIEKGAKELEFESDFMEVISVEGHSYIFFVSYSYYSNKYSLSYIEVFIAKTEQVQVNELIVSLDTYMNLAKTTIAESSEPIMIVKLTDTYIGLIEIFKSNLVNVFPICMVDQYLSDKGTCGQCPLGSYGLSMQSTTCNSCAYLNSVRLTQDEFRKLQFLCMNKIGQISSDNRGVYDEQTYPTEA